MALIAVIGGSGVGQELAGAARGQTLDIDTPFGSPSSPLVRAQWQGVDIVFLSRHGPGHILPPTAVPYRANIWALKAAGVTHIISSGATGRSEERRGWRWGSV